MTCSDKHQQQITCIALLPAMKEEHDYGVIASHAGGHSSCLELMLTHLLLTHRTQQGVTGTKASLSDANQQHCEQLLGLPDPAPLSPQNAASLKGLVGLASLTLELLVAFHVSLLPACCALPACTVSDCIPGSECKPALFERAQCAVMRCVVGSAAESPAQSMLRIYQSSHR